MRNTVYFIAAISLVLGTSCVRSKIGVNSGDASNGRYSVDFPSGDVSGELERITRSVRKVYRVTSYTTYQFKQEVKITGYHIRQGLYKKAAWGILSTNETLFGTATVISSDHDRISLLTCSHIVNSPDTLFSFFEPYDGDQTRYVRSFSIKEKQEIWVKELTDFGPIPVLVSDPDADIAILGKNCEVPTDTGIVLTIPAGRAKELGWGSFIYILGYPMGNQVITHGIVSPSVSRPFGEFSIDALLNKGYSGGVILAHRNGATGFEFVGMVKNVGMTRAEFLKPASNQQYAPDWIPYEGGIFVGWSDNIQYGLNTVITFDAILEFYKKYRKDLVSMGYDLDTFFFPHKQAF